MTDEQQMPDDPEDEFELEGDLDLGPVWKRKMSWDALPCKEVAMIQAKLGLVPSNEESAELEHRESHRRLKHVAPLEPAVEMFADIIAEILSVYLMEVVGGGKADAIPEPFKLKLVKQNTEIVRTGVITVLAQLLDNGVLGYTQKVMDKFAEAEHDEEHEGDV